MKQGKYHKTSMWTNVDNYIEEVAEWMNQNIGSGDRVEINIKVSKGNNISCYTADRLL